MENTPVTADTILSALKALVESGKIISKEQWLGYAFDLNLVRLDEAQLLHKMEQEVAKAKLEILKAQEKKNVAAADLEVASTDTYRFMKDQEDKLWSIDEFIRIAKRNADTTY